MQAIQESNEHVGSVKRLFDKVEAENKIYYEMELAKVKATHAVAYALLAVANAVVGRTPSG